MPILDMPLEELKSYRGKNPKPQDFDQYWAKALEDLKKTDSKIELVRATFQAPGAECYDLFFQGVGGARVHAKYLKPKSSEKTPHQAILQFHGYTGNAGDWFDKLAWVSAGYTVLALDCRGQGGQSEDNLQVKGRTLGGLITRGLGDSPDKLYFRNVFLDCAQLAQIAMELPEVDPTRVCCFGGSQGGALSLVCASLEPRIQRCATVFPFLSDYQRVWEMDLAKEAYEDLHSWFRLFDPLHLQEGKVFNTLGYIDIQHLVPRIKGEVLFFATQMDPICPPSTQFAAYNKIASKKEMVLYPDFGHEGLPQMMDRMFQFITK
jgi:cephalosporin-C deacetylase